MSSYISCYNQETRELEQFKVPKSVYVYVIQLECEIKYGRGGVQKLYPGRFEVRKMTEIPIGSKWKHKNSNDVYVVMEQYSHRVVLQHELTGTSIILTVGHLNPDGFADYERIEE